MPDPKAQIHPRNRVRHGLKRGGSGLIRHVRDLGRFVHADRHNTRELFQSPRHAPRSEVAEDPIGSKRGLGTLPSGPRRRHPWTVPARIAGTRRSIRRTIYPMIAPGMLLERNAAMNHTSVWCDAGTIG